MSLPGERHGLIFSKNGVSRANYMGPGTALHIRVPRGDKGKSPVDKAAKAHDLRYSLSKNEKAADKRFNAVVDKIQREGTDNIGNIAQAKLIKIKSSLGIPAKLFTSTGGTPKHLKPIYQAELNKLTQEGFGIAPKPKQRKKK